MHDGVECMCIGTECTRIRGWRACMYLDLHACGDAACSACVVYVACACMRMLCRSVILRWLHAWHAYVSTCIACASVCMHAVCIGSACMVYIACNHDMCVCAALPCSAGLLALPHVWYVCMRCVNALYMLPVHACVCCAEVPSCIGYMHSLV